MKHSLSERLCLMEFCQPLQFLLWNIPVRDLGQFAGPETHPVVREPLLDIVVDLTQLELLARTLAYSHGCNVMWLAQIISTLLGIRSLLKCHDNLRRCVNVVNVWDESLAPSEGLTYHGHVAKGRFIVVSLAVLLVRLLFLSVVLRLVKIVAVFVLSLDDGGGVLELCVGEEGVGRGETGLVSKCQIVLILGLVQSSHWPAPGAVHCGVVSQGRQAGAEGRLVGLAGGQAGAALDKTGAGGRVAVGRGI